MTEEANLKEELIQLKLNGLRNSMTRKLWLCLILVVFVIIFLKVI